MGRSDSAVYEGRLVAISETSAWSLAAWLRQHSLTHIGPLLVVGSSMELENPKNLVDLGISAEKRLLLDELGEDTSDGPCIDT